MLCCGGCQRRTALNSNAIALARLLVRAGQGNTTLNRWENDFVTGLASRLHDPGVRLGHRQMAVVRRLSDTMEMPDSNRVWIARFNRFSLALQDRGVDGGVIGDSMRAAWPSWDDA